MRAGVASSSIAALALTGCNLVLTDYDTADGPATTTSSGTGGFGEPAAGLEAASLGASAADGVRVSRAAHFRMDADAASRWQWARWYFLAQDPQASQPFGSVDHPGENGVPITRSACFWTAAHSTDNLFWPKSCPASSDPDLGVGEVAGEPFRDDATPVWYALGASVASWETTITFSSRVYASGLVWNRAHIVYNTGAPDPDASGFDFGFGEIALSSNHFEPPSSSAEGLVAQGNGDAAVLSVRVDSPSAAAWLVLTGHNDQTGEDDAGGMWEVLDESLPVGVEKTYRSAFFLGEKNQLASTRDERAADLLDSSVERVTGGAVQFSGGRDPDGGAFVLAHDGSGSASFTLDAGHAHFDPAFEVQGWTSPTWTLRRGGEVIASSAHGGPTALGKATGSKLVFQFLGTIAASAPEAERTFALGAD